MPEHEPGHRHDRGLRYDLATLPDRAMQAVEPVRIERRHALRLLGGAGLGAVVLAACGGSSDSSGDVAGTTPTSDGATTTAGAGSASTAAAGSASGTTSGDAIPEETAGPFPGDGSNGSNVLTESGIVRRDIRSSFGALSGTAEGVPLEVSLTVVDATTGAPLPGAAVYLWHCTADGAYSLYSQGVADQNFLRGVQAAGDDGTLRFTTVFPGAYPGRWPHMHFEVFADLEAATAAGGRLVTSQLAVPEEVCREVYDGDGRYGNSSRTLTGTSLSGDMVFSDGYESQLATVTGGLADLAASLTVRV